MIYLDDQVNRIDRRNHGWEILNRLKSKNQEFSSFIRKGRECSFDNKKKFFLRTRIIWKQQKGKKNSDIRDSQYYLTAKVEQ